MVFALIFFPSSIFLYSSFQRHLSRFSNHSLGWNWRCNGVFHLRFHASLKTLLVPFFFVDSATMSHPSWLPVKSTGEPLGHVPARMETTHSFGTPSISVSTQQPPKKFAPVVAPKPKYNPYKQPGGEGEYPVP